MGAKIRFELGRRHALGKQPVLVNVCIEFTIDLKGWNAANFLRQTGVVDLQTHGECCLLDQFLVDHVLQVLPARYQVVEL